LLITATCPPLFEGTALADLALVVGENYEMIITPALIFSATHTDICPLTGTLREFDCTSEYTGTGITMSSMGADFTISLSLNQPGTGNVCLEFTNGQDTKTLI
jgi:hypothetical protein